VTGPSPPGAAPAAPTRRTFAGLALGAAAFIVYGSLVPFNFHPRPWGEAGGAFAAAMTGRAGIDSRSDTLANILIAVPLGFTLLAACRADRAGRGRDVLVGALLLPACVGLAVAVEFGQLFVPSRTCSGSDVWCQGVGAAAGMAGWVWAGRRLTAHARVVWAKTDVAGAAGRSLLAYLLLLAVIQTLPFDLTPSPKDLYKKVRDGVRVVPFGEFRGAAGDRAWDHAAKLLKLVGLYLPLGLLAATLPSRRWESAPRVLVAAVGVACGLEAIQLVIASRTPGGTDVLAGVLGALAGWALGRRRVGAEAALALGQLWAAVLVVAYWQPFDFRGPPTRFDWVAAVLAEGVDPLATLEELLTKVVLFAPFGVLWVRTGGRPGGRVRVWAAVATGAVVAATIEAGQRYLPAHSPGVTDVILGGAGAFAGAVFGGRGRPA
jgi:VanZ family protein